MDPRPLLRRSARTALQLAPILLASNTLLGCGLFSSSQRFTLRPATSVPASMGEMQTSTDDNGNVRLTIRGKHMADPSKVAPDATVYVAWVQPGSSLIQNVGAIKVSDDLEGSLETLTPYRRFALSVTPEPSSRVTKPTHDAVFTSDVDLGD